MSINDVLFDNSNVNVFGLKLCVGFLTFFYIWDINFVVFSITWYIKTILHYIYLLTKENKINDLNKRPTHSLLFPLPSLLPRDTSNHN